MASHYLVFADGGANAGQCVYEILRGLGGGVVISFGHSLFWKQCINHGFWFHTFYPKVIDTLNMLCNKECPIYLIIHEESVQNPDELHSLHEIMQRGNAFVFYIVANPPREIPSCLSKDFRYLILYKQSRGTVQSILEDVPQCGPFCWEQIARVLDEGGYMIVDLLQQDFFLSNEIDE